jgi:hypothetical protein
MLVVAHVGAEERRGRTSRPARAGSVFDLLGPMPYLALQAMIDEDTRHGLGHYSKSHWLTASTTS